MHILKPARRLIFALALVPLLFGCTVVGPDAIRSGRLAYNEAINETNNEQMLMVLVRNRYDETNSLLAVASVTANIRMAGSAAVQAGFGDGDDYEGNLVPFSGGFVYEENPTISYSPVSGEAYMRALMQPIPIALFAQVTATMPNPELAYAMLLASVNGIISPAFLYGEQGDDPRYARFVALMTELTRRHRLHWVREPGEGSRLFLMLQPDSPDTVALAEELLELLGIRKPVVQGERLVVPAALALNNSQFGGIGITTRTIWELVQIMSAAVEAPAADVQDGSAAPPLRPGLAGRDLKVHYAAERPDTAYVAVEHRGGWFYIDDRDRYTKGYFKLMGSLWTVAMSESLGVGASAPVLTVPVSR